MREQLALRHQHQGGLYERWTMNSNNGPLPLATYCVLSQAAALLEHELSM